MMLPWNDRAGRLSPLKAAVFASCFVPAILLAMAALRGLPGASGSLGPLGPRPVAQAIHETGDWAIRFLMISLAVTPLRRIADWPKLILVRRMLGLTALAYALLHLFLYIADQKFNLSLVVAEIVSRVYLTIGFAALMGLAVLGATSTDAAIRRLGRRWTQLHRIVYALAALGTLHFFMQTKADVFQATLMAGLFVLLMLLRLAHWRGFDLSSPVVLGAVAVIAAVSTAAIEYAWYGLATGVPPSRVLAANLNFAGVIRPAWWVLVSGLGVMILGWSRGRPRARRTSGRIARASA